MRRDLRVLAATALATLALYASVPAAVAQSAPAAATVAPATAGLPVAADEARLLKLQGAMNVRSFAGLMGSNGPIPAASFLRAADLNRLTVADRDMLASRGVSLGVDLRTAEEAAGAADVLAADARFKYTRISLLGGDKVQLATLPDSLGELYVQSLTASPAQFRQVFETIAAHEGGTVLFHCTAGKDRTGMISAMLLALAGVPRNEIVHNYSISAHYLEPMMKSPQIADLVRQNPKVAAMLGTPPEAIESFLDSLDRQHGGARAYLRSIGVSDADVQRLMVRLGQSPT
jgi:protein-tyrosine phosphatase